MNCEDNRLISLVNNSFTVHQAVIVLNYTESVKILLYCTLSLQNASYEISLV